METTETTMNTEVETTLQETTNTVDTTTSDVKTEETNQTTEDVITRDDFDKAIKASRQRAITDLYKELGVKSKDEILNAMNASKEDQDIKPKYENLQNELKTLKRDNLYRDLGIDESQKDLFELTTNAYAEKNNISFSDAASKIVEMNSGFVHKNNMPAIEKSVSVDDGQRYSSNLLSIKPYLKNN